jgi:GT2 family glycosyltransferase
MDDRFFFGHDDVDWCLRARQAGLRSVVVGQVLARHKVSTTGGIRGSTVLTPFSAYHHAKGSVLIGRKHASGWALLPYALGQLCVRFPYYSLQMLRAGQARGVFAYAQGLFDGWRAYVWPGREA